MCGTPTGDDPGYVKRAWCLFELYTAIKRREDVEIDIILSPKQAQSFQARISADGTDAGAIDGALAHVRSEQATASVPADLEAIRTLIEGYAGGFDTLNGTVKQYLGRWFAAHGGTKVARSIAPNAPHVVSHVGSNHSSLDDNDGHMVVADTKNLASEEFGFPSNELEI